MDASDGKGTAGEAEAEAEAEAGTGLPVGARAPEFTAPLVQPGGETERVALSTLLEEKPVLLSFYTVDFSPDCIDEWCSFRDFEWFASGDAVQVVGVSKSGPRLHRGFIQLLDLNFPLYTDPDMAVGRAYDVSYRAFGLFERPRRSCFLIDSDRRIRYTWIADHWLDPSRDTPPMDELRTAVREELGDDDPDTFGF
jgi:peroxiredoxin